MSEEQRPAPPEETTTPPHGDPLAPASAPDETPGLPRTEEPAEPEEPERAG